MIQREIGGNWGQIKISLGGLVQDGLASEMQRGVGPQASTAPAAPADPLGEFIDRHEQAWADRHRTYDQLVEVFSDTPHIDRSEDLLLAGSFNGAALTRFAARGAALITSEMAANGYAPVASEVYFQPDVNGSRPIRIDGVFMRDGLVVFGEAKIGDYADLTRNQKGGLPALQQGAGRFYGANSMALARELGVIPDSSGKFRIAADRIQGVYVATYERARPPTNRMQTLNDAFRRGGGVFRGAGD